MDSGYHLRMQSQNILQVCYFWKILADHQCVSKKEMKINGSDLIKMGVEPGPRLGDILDRLYEQVLDDPSLNEAQKLKELANKIITSLI